MDQSPFPIAERNDRILAVRLPAALYADLVALQRVYGVASTSLALRALLRRAIDGITDAMTADQKEALEREKSRVRRPTTGRQRSPDAKRRRSTGRLSAAPE